LNGFSSLTTYTFTVLVEAVPSASTNLQWNWAWRTYHALGGIRASFVPSSSSIPLATSTPPQLPTSTPPAEPTSTPPIVPTSTPPPIANDDDSSSFGLNAILIVFLVGGPIILILTTTVIYLFFKNKRLSDELSVEMNEMNPEGRAARKNLPQINVADRGSYNLGGGKNWSRLVESTEPDNDLSIGVPIGAPYQPPQRGIL